MEVCDVHGVKPLREAHEEHATAGNTNYLRLVREYGNYLMAENIQDKP
jgi:hypothetical protein